MGASMWLVLLFTVAVSAIVFDCPALPPPPPPANVSELRPGHIKVVLAMGDSITAAFGARGFKDGTVEARGISASIGGDANATTVPNFLRFYSPDLQGPSLGQHFVEFCYGKLCPPYQYRPALDVLNSAQSGALVSDLVSHELDYLLQTMKANPNINLQQDWKLLTIFIGGNDLCASCENGTLQDPDDFAAHLVETLEGIKATIPRVFVQIMEIFNVSQVYDLSLKSPYCVDVHRDFYFECPCVFGADANVTRTVVDTYSQAYNARIRAIAAHYQSLKYPEFTVVNQPFARNMALKDLPISILSTVDCFHPSVYGHESLAIALWNNMLTPAAFKKTTINLADTPLCPTADTLLYNY